MPTETEGYAGVGTVLLAENLLVQVLKQSLSALIFSNQQKQPEQLGPRPPTTLSDNDESLVFSPRVTKER